METRPVKIFSYADSPRLRFVADLILSEMLGLRWDVVTDRRRLGKSPVINYSREDIPGTFRIDPVDLLFEKSVVAQEINVTEWKGLPVFFLSGNGSDLPFDIFASSFYLVSRYEEYLESETDEFGRFRSANSLAVRKGFNLIPVVDLWVREMSRLLVRRYPWLTFRKNTYSAIVSFDADEPYKFLGRDIAGNIGGLLRDITTGTGNAGRRLGCLTGKNKDPFSEAFRFISEECDSRDSATKYFFPTGDQTDLDRNPSWKNERYRDLISATAQRSDIGLHPSFNAGHDARLLEIENRRLASITGHDNRVSRFHFLRIKFPLSYRNLIETGLTEDYSMGYPDEPGFRAGIARSFRFYDLEKETITSLRIFPFQIMDVVLKDSKKYSPGECQDIIRELIMQVKKAGGLFISIWHNTTLIDTPECKEWRDLFRFMLDMQDA
jgi:hypothetical protein